MHDSKFSTNSTDLVGEGSRLFGGRRRRSQRSRGFDGPLRVGVLIDLEASPSAGGHVKCWQRLAEAAARRDVGIDLTVHFQGPVRKEIPLAAHVRYALSPPVFSTARLPFIPSTPADTDLAPFHPALARWLLRYDVVHTTDAYFNYASTARLMTRILRRPLTTSLHTDTPSYTRKYSEKAIRGLLGDGALADFLCDTLAMPERLGRRMDARLRRYMARCDAVLVSERHGQTRPDGLRPDAPVGILRRAVDRNLFHPRRRDRARLQSAFGIPAERFVLLFAGRLDHGKSVMTLAHAARALLDCGADIQAVFAGDGPEIETIGALLGDRATLPGNLPQDSLAWLYASADLFAFPSQVEISPNVVLEAMASGLPVLVAQSGGGVYVERNGQDGFVLFDADPDLWSNTIEALIAAPDRLQAVGARAREAAVTRHPTWNDVLLQDLIPTWREAFRRKLEQRSQHVRQTDRPSHPAS